MKAEITINGKKEIIELARSLNTGAEKQLRSFVKSKGLVWKDCEFFVSNHPESGRYLQKSAGYESINAGG